MVARIVVGSGTGRNVKIVLCSGAQVRKDRFVEPDRLAGIGDCRSGKALGAFAEPDNAVCRLVSGPPVDVRAVVRHLANRDAADIDACERLCPGIPLAVVVVGGKVHLDVVSDQVEVVGRSRYEPADGDRSADPARSRDRIDLGAVGRCRVVNGDDCPLVRVPADDRRRVGDGRSLDVREERPFDVFGHLLRKAQARDDELRGKVDARFRRRVVVPVVLERLVRGGTSHERSLGTSVFVGHSAGVVAVRVRCAVVRVVLGP